MAGDCHRGRPDERDPRMKPLKLKSATSLRLRIGYFLLLTMFLTAFVYSTAKAHFLTP
jgi:hypothetical protein